MANKTAAEAGFITLCLNADEILTILKSLKKCVPEVDDQEKVFNLVQYLETQLEK